jgi:hypothetical protein
VLKLLIEGKLSKEISSILKSVSKQLTPTAKICSIKNLSNTGELTAKPFGMDGSKTI